ncbi:hypothetical protein HanXRQr2_Chr05g0219681 [Helianthus annuus]|uniref:Uncharacterized protein n=1 Tax=Helianthus annuus TaxID=4232 RepID=A0A9K3J0X9_HELAN|nr:hypothetical protein HanXRQr2_Chr05g0219681 [Helianthus annuus]
METSAPADLLRTVSQDPLWSVEGAQQPEKWQPLVFNALETKNSCFPSCFLHLTLVRTSFDQGHLMRHV